MKRGLIIIVSVMFAGSLALIRFAPSSPEHPLEIRIVGLRTNKFPPYGGEWEVAVPKSKSHFSAVLFWSLRYEETNKTSVKATAIIRLPTAGCVDGEAVFAPNEEGIVSCGGGQSLDSGKIYRVIGAYYEPSVLEYKLHSLGMHLPIARLMPEPKPRFVTSEWFEVTSMLKPL